MLLILIITPCFSFNTCLLFRTVACQTKYLTVEKWFSLSLHSSANIFVSGNFNSHHVKQFHHSNTADATGIHGFNFYVAHSFCQTVDFLLLIFIRTLTNMTLYWIWCLAQLKTFVMFCNSVLLGIQIMLQSVFIFPLTH